MRDGLAIRDWIVGFLVGDFAEARADKSFSWNIAHRRQIISIAHASAGKLGFDHLLAGGPFVEICDGCDPSRMVR